MSDIKKQYLFARSVSPYFHFSKIQECRVDSTKQFAFYSRATSWCVAGGIQSNKPGKMHCSHLVLTR